VKHHERDEVNGYPAPGPVRHNYLLKLIKNEFMQRPQNADGQCHVELLNQYRRKWDFAKEGERLVFCLWLHMKSLFSAYVLCDCRASNGKPKLKEAPQQSSLLGYLSSPN
jgi:hypothetical protein